MQLACVVMSKSIVRHRACFALLLLIKCGVCVCVCVGVWVCGCVGVWVCVCGCGWVGTFHTSLAEYYQ